MSSFSDNFKRDEEEDMLEYDDGAFYYFSIAILSAILIPFTWGLIKSIIWGDIEVTVLPQQCKCARCTALITLKKRAARASTWNKSFYIKLFVAAILWYIWYLNFDMVSKIEGIQAFDPFQILEVPTDASIRDIKKQYRAKSLTMHPDKNPDNPLAVQEFIRLTKAYNILTDETAFDNFKKYGNPDGPGGGQMNVSIAMPSFLLEKENQIPVLCATFFILLVVIPGLLYVNFGDSSTKDESGVLIENKRGYGAKLNENLLVKNVPMILATSLEFQDIGAKNQDEIALLKKIKQNEDVDEMLPKVQSRRTQDMNMKPLLLILGHIMQDENVKHPAFKDGLSQILRQGVSHLDMMIQTAMEINAMNRQGATSKKLGFKTIQSVINFGQYFIQGLWSNCDPMMQLGLEREDIKMYRKQLREHQIPDGKIETFCRLSKEQRASFGLFGGNKAKLAEMEKIIQAMPLVTVAQSVRVEGESTITASDIISFTISLTYDNLPEDQGPGYVCSQAYPYLKRGQWYFVMVDERTRENVIQVETIQTDKDSNVCKFEMKQRFGQAGKFQFHCYMFNDSYIGFDKEVAIEVDVVKDDPSRVVIEYSNEDIAAVKGPGLVQSMLQEEEESDGESSDDNPEILLKKLEDAGLKTPEGKKYQEVKAKKVAAEKE